MQWRVLLCVPLQSTLGSPLTLKSVFGSGNSDEMVVPLGSSVTTATTFRLYAYVPADSNFVYFIRISVLGPQLSAYIRMA
jgi:hypothetical protein